VIQLNATSKTLLQKQNSQIIDAKNDENVQHSISFQGFFKDFEIFFKAF